VLILLLKSEGFEWDSKMLMSSADKKGTDLSHTDLGISFIKMRKSKGQKTKPWGTPCLTLAQADIGILPSSYIVIIQQCSLISVGQIGFVKCIMLMNFAIEIKFR
jgi:hypothetical protein